MLYPEYEVAVYSVIQEYRYLQELNPRHELLSLVRDVGCNRFKITKEFSKKYDKRDGMRGLEHRIHLLQNYRESLRNAAIQENDALCKEEEKILRIINEKNK